MGESAIRNMLQKVANESLMLLQSWLSHHPLLLWAIAHPIWSIVLVLLSLWLLWGLFGAIVRLAEHFWIHLLQFPFRLVQWAFAHLTRRKGVPWWVPHAPGDRQAKLKDLLHRLEVIRQEQDRLLEEIRALLRSGDL